ncbi:MAG: hypothetical protein AB8E82_05590 [Aureispira sp.]
MHSFSLLLLFGIFGWIGIDSLCAQSLRLGVHAGPTTTDFYDQHHSLAENFWGIPTLGATFGMTEQLVISNWGQLQLEQNVSWEGNKGHFWTDNNLNLWYITMPVLMKFKLSPSFWVGGGLEANYLLEVTGSSDLYGGNYWNGAAIFQAEHTFLQHFSCTIRYLHGFTPTSIINYVNYEGENSTLSTYSGRRLHLSLSYFFYTIQMEPKWVEGETYFY